MKSLRGISAAFTAGCSFGAIFVGPTPLIWIGLLVFLATFTAIFKENRE